MLLWIHIDLIHLAAIVTWFTWRPYWPDSPGGHSDLIHLAAILTWFTWRPYWPDSPGGHIDLIHLAAILTCFTWRPYWPASSHFPSQVAFRLHVHWVAMVSPPDSPIWPPGEYSPIDHQASGGGGSLRVTPSWTVDPGHPPPPNCQGQGQ